MQTVTSFEAIPQNLEHPIAVTIGSYDGIHLGHQAIFRRLNELGNTSVVVTFSNHPTEILHPDSPSKLIYTPEKKIQLLKECKIDITILLKFTKETASNTYDQFLLTLRAKLPFDFLVLGADARLGKGRTGTPEAIKALAKEHNFQVEYLKQLTSEGQVISSQRIRHLLNTGQTEAASKLLGRPCRGIF